MCYMFYGRCNNMIFTIPSSLIYVNPSHILSPPECWLLVISAVRYGYCIRSEFDSKSDLGGFVHADTQNGANKLLLPVKDARYDSYENYDMSLLFPNAKRYTCTCGKFYSQKSSLDRHLRYECGKMPNVPCPQCNKMFKHKHHVTQHLKSCRLKDQWKSEFPSC
ncbi:uncharacterized protein LOC143181435 [Calliopsis andreniformis]|uniref:uncharacterized protein LOC143181435 n=1 Tax=Calliopsis andreniformis TaxID=337506 RepID=UPI003FCC5037